MGLKKIIGVNAMSYPEIRNFVGHKFENYTFKKVYDFYKIPSFLLFRIFNKINRRWQNTFNDFGLNKVRFFHFFNTISNGNKPFITTYETTIPRWKDAIDDFDKGLRLLAGENCRQIIALSDCAFQKQANLIKLYRPDLTQIIMNKNCVLLPPQITFLKQFEDKRPIGEIIEFTMVGADFFRKGGMAILNAFDYLLKENYPVHLNIISSLNYGDYASQTSISDYQIALKIIKKHQGKISWYQKLENKKVESLLLNTDVAILTSLAETFGYFILEAQAAGCPVITTDIRAMPEINDDDKGWLIRIKKENDFDADLTIVPILTEKITSELIRIIISITDNPEIIHKKGSLAFQNIINKHSPEAHMHKLQEIYDRL